MRDLNFKYSFIVVIIIITSLSSYCIEMLYLYYIGPIRTAAFYDVAARRRPRVWPG